MAKYDELSASNSLHAESYTHGDLPKPPARQVAVITCMDARLHPGDVPGVGCG